MSLLSGKKVLGVLCHADDEIISGWPIFQNREIDRYLVIVCDDVRRKGENRLIALEDVCRRFGIHLVMAGKIESDFYRLPTRFADCVLVNAIREINAMVTEAVLSVKPNFVFSHNPVGFYGHGDHKLLFNIVNDHPMTYNVLFTDLCRKNKCHRSFHKLPESVRKAFYWKRLYFPVQLDEQFYREGMEIYRQLRAWTWEASLPIVENRVTGLYILKEEK